MSVKTATTLCVFGITAFLVAFWLFQKPPENVARVEHRENADSPADISTDVGKFTEESNPASTESHPTVVAAAAIAPLPDNKLPLSEQITSLLQRSEAGDTVASCRLAISVSRCKEEQRSRAATESMARSLAAKKGLSDKLVLDIIAREEEARESRGNYCKNVDTRNLPQPDDVIRKSLHALSPRQKTILALTRSDGTLRRVNGHFGFSESGLFVLPQFLADHTVDFLMEGYRARDPLALEGLVMLHSPGNALAPSSVGVWLPNPRLFLRYSLLMFELYGAESLGNSALSLMQVSAAAVPADELAKIRQSVDAEAKQWRVHVERSPSPLLMRNPNGDEKDFTACEE